MYSASERTWSILALEIVPCTIFFPAFAEALYSVARCKITVHLCGF